MARNESRKVNLTFCSSRRARIGIGVRQTLGVGPSNNGVRVKSEGAALFWT